MKADNDNLSRDGDWWTAQAVTLGALVLFFYAIFPFLTYLAPERMPQ